MATKKASEFDKVVEKIEAKAEEFGDNVENGVINWIRNDRFFNGFRNTYARMLITGMTWLALFGLGTWAFVRPSLSGVYIVVLVILTLMNQLSVRFAFNVDHESDLTDEYQAKRRDAAYRRAYRKVSHQLVAGYILFFGVRAIVDFQVVGLDTWLDLATPGELGIFFHTNLDQMIVLCTFYIALFGLQKYMSWGFKGEPWQDSARK